MTAFLRTISQIVAYGDTSTETNNPRLRYVDWNRDQSRSVRNPRSESHVLAPGEEKVLFDGTRELTLDATSEFSVELVAGKTDLYRFRWTGGADPGFRQDRALDLTGATVTVAVNSNLTATMTVTDGSFAGVQAGDTLWVPGTTEVASTPFHSLNRGFWVVLAASPGSLVLQRAGTFEAYAQESVSITSADQLQAYSSDGVQEGETLEVTDGFATASQRSFTITGVTSKYLEVQSSAALPGEENILPGVGGMLVYTSARDFIYIEADQECVVQSNGDEGASQRVSPWLAGDPAYVGVYQKTGPTWSLKVRNRASKPMSLTVISAERA